MHLPAPGPDTSFPFSHAIGQAKAGKSGRLQSFGAEKVVRFAKGEPV
jgi:hypothetical protein